MSELLFHECRRWQEKGMSCPFDPLEEERVEQDEDAQAAPSGAEALQEAVGKEIAGRGFGEMSQTLGPLLALFTILRGIQTLAGAPGIGRIEGAGMAEEATTRVLRPQVPLREGPSPAKVPVPATFGAKTPPTRGFGGGFFGNQAAELKRMVAERGR